MGSLARYALVLAAIALAAGVGAVVGDWSGDEPSPSASPDERVSGTPTPYQGRLGALVGGLAGLREKGFAELRRADDQPAQIRAIDSLTTAYDATADALADMTAPQSIRGEHAAAEAAVADTLSAYRALGLAAERGDREAYESAREAVRRAEAASAARLTATLNAAGGQS